MKYKREEHGFAIGPDSKLYAIGGFDGKKCLNTAERYNIHTGQWEEIKPLHHARRSLSAVSLPDGIYALGGYDGHNYLRSVEKYNIERNEWMVISPMTHSRCTLSCVSWLGNGAIYALGGYDDSPLSLVEKYDVVYNKWEKIKPMKYKRFMHAAVLAP